MALPINHIGNNSHIEMNALEPSQNPQVFWQIQWRQPIPENIETNLAECSYDLDRQEYTNFSFPLDQTPQNPMCLAIKGSVFSDHDRNNYYDLYVNNQLVQSFEIVQNVETVLTLIIPEELFMNGQNLIAIKGTNDWVFHVNSISLSTSDL